MSAFSFKEFEGETIKGNPDLKLFEEALQRFHHAREAMQGHNVDILEYPLSGDKSLARQKDHVFIRYHKEDGAYEIKIFQVGHYNTRSVLGHFFLRENKPEARYEMTIS